MSTSSCVIYARAFSSSTSDTLRDRWTQAKMEHVVRHLGDSKVVIELDNRTGHTGHTVLGVKLLGVRPNPWGGQGEVLVDYCHEDGSGTPVWHRLESIGFILPLEATNAKWDALRSYRDLQSAAIQQAQAEYAESTGRKWGQWAAQPMGRNTVMVTYTPHTGNPHFADQWGERGWWTIHVKQEVSA